MATAKEVQEVTQKPARIGSLGESLELQVADATAQQHEEVLIVEQSKLDSCPMQQREAVPMKGVGVQPAGKHLGSSVLRFEIGIENTAHTGHQLGRAVARVGDSENFFRPGDSCLDEVGNASRQHRGLAGPGARYHEHRPVHTLNGLPLLVSRNERAMSVVAHDDFLAVRRKSEGNHYAAATGSSARANSGQRTSAFCNT